MIAKRCKFHKCDREFETEDARREFCSPQCQKGRAKWREKRGATVIDDLLSWNTAELLRARRRIEEEMDRDRGTAPRPSSKRYGKK